MLKLVRNFRLAISDTMQTVGAVKAVLIDLSGTLHVEDMAVPGSQSALERLRHSGVGIKFVTNTTKESKAHLHQKLVSLGFKIELQEIFTSLTAAVNLVQERQLRPLLFLEESAIEDFKGISQEDPNAVVIGLAPGCFNYPSMNKAFRLLQSGASLIAIHKARYYKKKDGLAIGPGAFIEGLEYSTGVQAEVVGKPETRFFLGALDTMGVCPEETVMIGDDAKDDIAGAKRAGISGILVKTGKYRESDESKFHPPPDIVCEDFPSAVDYILSKISSQ